MYIHIHELLDSQRHNDAIKSFWLQDRMCILETEPAGDRCPSARNALSTYLAPFIRQVKAETRRNHFCSAGLVPLTYTVWSGIPTTCVRYCREMETYNHLCAFWNYTSVQRFGVGTFIFFYVFPVRIYFKM